MSIPDPVTMDSVAMPNARMTSQPETEILWSSGEGQVANFGVYVFAVLFFWLVFPVAWALYRYIKTSKHRYTLTDQRLMIESVQWNLIVRHMEFVELYRVKDLSVGSTLSQTLFGRGRVIVKSTDETCPLVVINAIANPVEVSRVIRNAVEQCRVTKGVRAFDY